MTAVDWSDPYSLLAPSTPSSPVSEMLVRARASGTLNAYQLDWGKWLQWCTAGGHTPLPAAPVTLATYLETLAADGARMGSIARAKAAIRLAHQVHGHADPSTSPQVHVAWQAISREISANTVRTPPLAPPDLWQVVDACPVTRTWQARHRPPEPSLAGLRDRVLLLVGFITAARPGELVALRWEDIRPADEGLLADLRTPGDPHGAGRTVVVPRSGDAEHCPVRALDAWRDVLPDQLRRGPVLRAVNKGNHAHGEELTTEALSGLVRAAAQRAGVSPARGTGRFSASSLRAGFVAHAMALGISIGEISRQSGHRSFLADPADDMVWQRTAALRLGL